jgi:hypothetical protein
MEMYARCLETATEKDDWETLLLRIPEGFPCFRLESVFALRWPL